MTAQTFAQIEALAFALPVSDLTSRIQRMVMEAQENAHNTVFVDKTATDEAAVALASLECVLCYCDDMDVCRWFAENDVAF